MESTTKSKKGYKSGKLHKMYKHGHAGVNRTITYTSWVKMKERCVYTGEKRYKCYKEITYTDRWDSFENFLEDMGERPLGTSLDRINNKEGYSKDNCRWASASEQASNTTRNAYYLINGMQYCQEQAARALNITTKTIRGMRRRNDFPNHVQFIGHINA
jgi:hypothetical protein